MVSNYLLWPSGDTVGYLQGEIFLVCFKKKNVRPDPLFTIFVSLYITTLSTNRNFISAAARNFLLRVVLSQDLIEIYQRSCLSLSVSFIR